MASLGQLSTQDGQGGQDESGCSEPLALASKNEGEPRQVSDEPISNSSSTNGSSDSNKIIKDLGWPVRFPLTCSKTDPQLPPIPAKLAG